MIKQLSIPGVGDDNEEQMLWIDLFASLFLFMSLMISNHTAEPVTKTDAVGSVVASNAPPPIKLFLTREGSLQMHSVSGVTVDIDQLSKLVASSGKQLILVGSSMTDGVLIFETLQKLQSSGFSVNYLAY